MTPILATSQKFWKKEIDSFLNYLKFDRSASIHTLKTYQRILLLAGTQFFTVQKIECWQKCSPMLIRRWIVGLRKEHLSSNSLNLYLSTLRTFFRWLFRFNLEQLQIITCKMHSRKQRLPKIISPEQALHLVSISENDSISVRDCAILELFYSSGLRLQELATLKKSSLSNDHSLLNILGKGNKERWVPIGQRAKARLEKWFEVCQRNNISSSYIFTTLTSKPLSLRAIQKRVAYWGFKKLNLHLHPHVLRHTFATHFLSATQDIRAVQEILGHQKLATTQRYTHLNFKKITEIYDKTHPRQKNSESIT